MKNSMTNVIELGTDALQIAPASSFRPAVRAAVAPPATTADTLGWDTVFALRLPDVNRTLQKPGASPAQFSGVIDKDSNYTVNGTFGLWQVGMEGDGQNIHLLIAVKNAIVTLGTAQSAVRSVTLRVEVTLRFLPQPPSANGQPHNLKINTTAASPAEPVASILSMSYDAGPALDPMWEALFKGAMNAWFNAHLNEFTHVFSTVNLNSRADRDDFQWLAPTYTNYAYLDGDSPQDSFFAVLCMTEGRSQTGLTSTLSPAAIPQTQRASFVIAQERFLDKMIIPALPGAFVGASVSDFSLSADGLSVVNNRTLKSQDVSHGGITYHPSVSEVKVTISGSEILLYTLTDVEISPGITAHIENTSYQKLVIANRPDGAQVLTWQKTREPDTKHWVTKSLAVEITEAILIIVGVIATAIATVLTGGAALFIALVIIGLVVGLAAATPDLIAQVSGNAVSNKIPSIDLLVSNATSPIIWPGGSGYKLTDATLNGALQLSGDPGF